MHERENVLCVRLVKKMPARREGEGEGWAYDGDRKGAKTVGGAVNRAAAKLGPMRVSGGW
jgi:hypothetical protein